MPKNILPAVIIHTDNQREEFKMTVTFILKGNLEILPPVIPRIIMFAQSGVKVFFICTAINDRNKILFEENGIKVYETKHRISFLGKHSKIHDWLGFQMAAKKLLREEKLENSILYICSADTALALGRVVFKYKYVFQSNELYDRFARYRNGIRPYAQHAIAFVVPEYIRANICMYWYKLKSVPFIIPNFPYLVSKEKKQIIDDGNAKKTIEVLSDKKIILYQGYITFGDRSLNAVAEALKEIANSEFVLLLMGVNNNGSYEKIKEIYEHTYYIPFIKAPAHLQITSHAYIGILSYDRVSLNNMFCAPNKIYEYSAFDVPMLGNNIPGLRDTIEKERMGECADFERIDSVKNSIISIDMKHKLYSDNAANFYNNASFISEMNRLIEYIKGYENK